MFGLTSPRVKSDATKNTNYETVNLLSVLAIKPVQIA